MTTEPRHHLIGLWKIWDIIPESPEPRRRSPEAILERYARAFQLAPDARELRMAFAGERDALDPEVEASELIGHLVVGDNNAWKALRERPGWSREGERRQAPGDGQIDEVTVYGLERSHLVEPTGSIWAPARDFGPPIAGVAESLRRLGDAMGLPPVEFGPEVPFFEGRGRARSPRRRSDRNRDRSVAGD